ncbi:MAG: DUF86 domain-containing protein [Actinobacteria bacterium]|nr:DUF86 domain-containing protein [Actinomycetota bacterium]
MMDKVVIDGILANLQLYVAQLDRLSKLGQDEFLGDPDKRGSAKYYFIVAIESCIDAANHIISSERYRRPSDFSDTFAVLYENKLIDEGLKEHLQNMARFRNLLVHVYGKVDDQRVHEFLKTSLGDFDAFARQIAQAVEKLDG